MARPRTQHKPLSPVAKNMVGIRQERDETQKEFADHLGLDLSKIARTEVGILKPSIELVELLMARCDVTANDLFREPGERTPKEQEIHDLQAALPKLNDKQRASVKTLIDALGKKLFTKVIISDRLVDGPGIDHD